MKNLSTVLLVFLITIKVSYAQQNIVSIKHFDDPSTITAFEITENENESILFGTSVIQTSIYLGYNAGRIHDRDQLGFNTVIGYNALSLSETGSSNTAIGYNTLKKTTTGNSNTAIGASALESNITGFNAVAIGSKALRSHEGSAPFAGMIAIGSQALAFDIDGHNTVAIGSNAAFMDTTATRSVYVGSSAGAGSTSPGFEHSKTDNVMLGYTAGFLATGDDNVYIGSESGFNALGSGNVYIGHNSGYNGMGNNQLYISNSDADSLNALIYGQFDNKTLRINGELTINNAYSLPTSGPVTGDILRYTGGNLNWTNLFTPWIDGPGNDIYYTSGDFGLGTASPDFKVDIVGNASTDFITRIQNANAGTDCDGLLIEAGPKVGVGTPDASAVYIEFQQSGGSSPLGEIVGNGSGGIAYNQTSDQRLKQGILDYQTGLSTLMKIKPRVYQMKVSPDVDEIGFIAQELYESFPQIVSGKPSDDLEKDGPMAVDYGRLTPVLVAAIQDQQKLIEELQERLDEKDGQFEMLKAELAKMNIVKVDRSK